MGKVTSIYLTDEEAAMLKEFCSANGCTQYTAIKTALRDMLAGSIDKKEEETGEPTREDESDHEERKTEQNSDKKGLLKLLSQLDGLSH